MRSHDALGYASSDEIRILDETETLTASLATRRMLVITHRLLLAAFVLTVPLCFGLHTNTAAAASLNNVLDTDHDGTLDLNEVKSAASAVFDKLDKDNDTTIDRKEAASRLSSKEFREADPDNDNTLSKDEYLELVERLFNAADVDKDGTIDAKELRSEAGRALTRLIH